jgi:hypothetical protein
MCPCRVCMYPCRVCMHSACTACAQKIGIAVADAHNTQKVAVNAGTYHSCCAGGLWSFSYPHLYLWASAKGSARAFWGGGGPPPIFRVQNTEKFRGHLAKLGKQKIGPPLLYDSTTQASCTCGLDTV